MKFLKALSFVREYPDLLRLLEGFPPISPETGRALVAFLNRAFSEKSPDRFIRESIESALARPRTVGVEIVSKKGLR